MEFDWNENGSRDAFDDSMDMETKDEVSGENGSADEFDTDTSFDSESYSGVSSDHVSHASNKTVNPNISFQDQLKNNMRSPETVKKERDDYRYSAMRWEGKQALIDIKTTLLNMAKEAEYTIENGKAVVTCFYPISQRFMRYRREDNIDRIKEKNFFRDRNLVYMVWANYEIEPNYRNEYLEFSTSLGLLAAKENITVETVIYNKNENKYASFPIRFRDDYSFGWQPQLCIRATTSIPTTITPSTTNMKPPAQKYEGPQQNEKKITGISMGGKKIYDSSKDSDGKTILKTFGCIACCLGGLILPVMMEAGPLGLAIGCFIGAGLGVLILNNT